MKLLKLTSIVTLVLLTAIRNDSSANVPIQTGQHMCFHNNDFYGITLPNGLCPNPDGEQDVFTNPDGTKVVMTHGDYRQKDHDLNNPDCVFTQRPIL